jgi:hypothetical protein
MFAYSKPKPFLREIVRRSKIFTFAGVAAAGRRGTQMRLFTRKRPAINALLK